MWRSLANDVREGSARRWAAVQGRVRGLRGLSHRALSRQERHG